MSPRTCQRDTRKMVSTNGQHALTSRRAKFNFSGFADLKTPLDDVFGWGPEPERQPPIFYKFPIKFNTVLNNTIPWGRDSIYLLGAGGPNMDSTKRGEYLICKAKAGLRPDCSTFFESEGSGGDMSTNCEDKSDLMAYNRANSSRALTSE
jgi:hypothetical protein